MPRTSQSAGFDIGAFIVTTRYTHNVKKFAAPTAPGNSLHCTEHTKWLIWYNETTARVVGANVLYFLNNPRSRETKIFVFQDVNVVFLGKLFPVVSKDHTAFVVRVNSSRRLVLFNPDDESTTVFWNIGNYSPIDTTSHPRRLEALATLLWNCQISHRDMLK